MIAACFTDTVIMAYRHPFRCVEEMCYWQINYGAPIPDFPKVAGERFLTRRHWGKKMRRRAKK